MSPSPIWRNLGGFNPLNSLKSPLPNPIARRYEASIGIVGDGVMFFLLIGYLDFCKSRILSFDKMQVFIYNIYWALMGEKLCFLQWKRLLR